MTCVTSVWGVHRDSFPSEAWPVLAAMVLGVGSHAAGTAPGSNGNSLCVTVKAQMWGLNRHMER